MNSLKLTNKIRYNFASFHSETPACICRPSPPPGTEAGAGGSRRPPGGGADNNIKTNI